MLMKLSSYTTAASFALLILAASCSKAPRASEPNNPAQGPPESAVRQYLIENQPPGLAIQSLDSDAKEDPAGDAWQVDFKLVCVTAEDFVERTTSAAAFESQNLEIDYSDQQMPTFYKISTPKGSDFIYHGKLVADHRIDKWSFQTKAVEGDRPAGNPVSEIPGKFLVLGSPEAEQYFGQFRESRDQRAEIISALKSQITSLFAPDKEFTGQVHGSKVYELQLKITSAEEPEQSARQGFWVFQGTALRDGVEMPLDGYAWLDEEAAPPSAIISLKLQRSSISSHRYKIRFADGELQPTENGTYTIELQPRN